MFFRSFLSKKRFTVSLGLVLHFHYPKSRACFPVLELFSSAPPKQHHYFYKVKYFNLIYLFEKWFHNNSFLHRRDEWLTVGCSVGSISFGLFDFDLFSWQNPANCLLSKRSSAHSEERERESEWKRRLDHLFHSSG